MFFKASMVLAATIFLAFSALAAPASGSVLEEPSLNPRAAPSLDLFKSTIKSQRICCADDIPRNKSSNKNDSTFLEAFNFHTKVPSWCAEIKSDLKKPW